MKQKIITDQDRTDFIEYLNKIKLDKTYVVECKQYRKKRSLSQNSLYWLWVNCIAQETGNTSKDIHDYLRGEYLPTRVYEVFGEYKRSTSSTTELNTKQFTDYLNAIERDVSTEGIKLLNPEDRNFEAFCEKYEDMIK